MRTPGLELIVAIALTFLLGVACTSAPSTTKDVTPPLPPPAFAGETAGNVIGSEGGTVVHVSGAKIVAPPGALAEGTRLTLTDVVAPSADVLAATPLGPSLEAGPDGQTFLKPVAPGETANASFIRALCR